MNLQRATAAFVLAACVGVAPGAYAHPRRHVHHKLARVVHHARAPAAHVTLHDALAHTGVMEVGDMVETNLPLDDTITLNGVEAGCTGIGEDAREDPRWESFPVRVEFSGAYNQYIPGGSLVVKDWDHKPLLYVRCDGPWVLLRLEPGTYRMAGLMAGYSRPQSWVVKLDAERKKTRRVVFHFDDIRGSTP